MSSPDFVPAPPIQFNYTGNAPWGLWTDSQGTNLYKLKYSSRCKLFCRILVTTEDHPIHLQGFHFFIVDLVLETSTRTDPANFNLVDPSVRNTIGTPLGGWVAIHSVPDNPGNILYFSQTLSFCSLY